MLKLDVPVRERNGVKIEGLNRRADQTRHKTGPFPQEYVFLDSGGIFFERKCPWAAKMKTPGKPADGVQGPWRPVKTRNQGLDEIHKPSNFWWIEIGLRSTLSLETHVL